jgi:3-oxoacyl-[acyl-carrier protein] reductase
MSDSQPPVALVTGASRGIGSASADTLIQEKLIVIGTATTEAGAASIDARLAPQGGAGLVLDVANEASIDALMSTVKERFGAPLILVNNAGITRDNILMRMKADEWDSVIDTNLSSVFRLSKACLRGMTKARWGRIVTITSVVGSMGNAGQANYAATKAGAEGFTRALAREVGSRAITVNAVAPGFIDTDMTRELSEENRTLMLDQIPLSRLGHPVEIAETVRFLVSDAAAYITGETIHVNGGMYMA